MKCPSADQWDLLAMGLLEDEPAERLVAHARGCPGCRERFHMARREHTERVRMYEAFDRDHDDLREQLLAALPEELPQPSREGWVSRGRRRLGGIAMSLNRSSVRRTAMVLVPAACIVVAVLISLTPRQRAFAAALEHMRQASTIVARFQAFMNGGDTPLVDGKMYLSEERGMFFDMGVPDTSGMQMYRAPDGPVILVQPALNLVMRMHGEFTALDGSQSQPRPDEFIRKFLDMTGEADRLLGESEVEGHMCQGFEVSGKKLGLEFGGSAAGEGLPEGAHTGARLWVDVETNLPVRMEVDVYVRVTDAQMQAVYDEFEWDAPLDDQLFVPQIPERAREIDVTIPPMTEETLVDGLRRYAEIVGHYPVALDPTSVGAEMAMALATKGAVQFDAADPGSAISDELVQDTMTATVACGFVQKLAADGHEPEYFGDIVSPEDVDDVLIHWRLDDGQMHVIYGDLSSETVPAGG